MSGKRKRVYFIWIVLTEVVGILAGIFTARGIKLYGVTAVKPMFSPPAVVFPVVWTLLYAVMGFGAARIYLGAAGRERSRGLNLYISQLVVNFFWPLFFFNAQVYGFSLLWLILLWTLVLAMIFVFRKVDKCAALLQIPYLIWLSFAVYLNTSIWVLNS